ncbi:DUF2007 domain-containing protein [Draconibacterium sp. IB214405]|uniref:putative signal transducing protein n=1 Tax=Draconibacterium sp. IB214405 TaxID=3097352 RepID=UPI002A0D2808|nr:DUF2007 domain-containing protein [Draconibacterium sp. IB214405]MDX8340782.1 DUF2007 domain-containing protein [Draconibacterium sp. IB214405]
MTQMNKTIKVFTGSEVQIALIKGELENQGISSLIKSDFNSGVAAGFSGGVPSAIDLYIESSDIEKATPIINGLMEKKQ